MFGLRNKIIRYFFRLLPPLVIENELKRIRIERSNYFVTIHPSSKMHEQSNVHNFQNDKSRIVIGANTHIRGNLQVFAYGGSIMVGDNCYVGENSYVWSGDRIVIGSNVLISHNVNIVDSNSHEIDHKERRKGYLDIITTGHPKNKGNILTSPIVIEDDVWISFGVIILKGVKIGKGAIVAAGSVVVKDVLPFTMVAGNPAKTIKTLSRDEF